MLPALVNTGVRSMLDLALTSVRSSARAFKLSKRLRIPLADHPVLNTRVLQPLPTASDIAKTAACRRLRRPEPLEPALFVG